MLCGVLVAFLGHLASFPEEVGVPAGVFLLRFQDGLASFPEEVGVLTVGCGLIAFPGSPGQHS